MGMFEGFVPETVDFLWGIRMNNNREWFMENKKNYVNYLYEPMKALGKDLFEPFLDKTGSELKVSRIYRDARMHPPTPYKESLWISIRRQDAWWVESPCLYFEITPEGVSYGMILWKPKTATMEQMRKAWADRPREILELLEQTEKITGVPVTADLYKRPKAAPMPELEQLYAWKGNISCTVEEPVSPQMFGPELGQRAKEFITKLIPLYEYFNQFCI